MPLGVAAWITRAEEFGLTTISGPHDDKSVEDILQSTIFLSSNHSSRRCGYGNEKHDISHRRNPPVRLYESGVQHGSLSVKTAR